METTRLKRKFILEKGTQKVTLADPDINLTTDDVMSFYASTYPEIVNCSVHGPEYKDDCAVYTFKTVVGTKG